MRRKSRHTTFRTSVGTKVYVEAPEVYVAPGITPEDLEAVWQSGGAGREALERIWQSGGAGREALERIWQSEGAGREALREEDSWRKGIKWFVGTDRLKYPERGVAPWIAGGLMNAGTQLPNGNFLLCDRAGHVVLEVDRELNIIWQFGEYGVSGTDLSHLNRPHYAYYDEDNDEVIISDDLNHRILAVKRGEDTAYKSLESTDLGSIGRPHSAVKNPLNGNLVIADLQYNVVVECDWEGAVSWYFGEYGVVGRDESHLARPTAAFPFRTDVTATQWDSFLISDYANGRILVVTRSDKAVNKKIVCPHPECAHPLPNLSIAVGSTEAGYCFLVNQYGFLVNWVPLSGAYFQPTREETLLLTDTTQIWEVDWRSYRPPKTPLYYQLLESGSLPAGQSVGPVYSTPDIYEARTIFITFPFTRKTIYVKSTQDGTLDILVGLCKGAWFKEWDVLDSVSIPADTLVKYQTTYDAFVSAVKITNTGAATATVDAWVALK